jgi:DNA-binding CsgD family transcriptional regulator
MMSQPSTIPAAVLTERERVAVPLLIQNCSLAELAAALGCTLDSAKDLSRTIYEKLQVRDRGDLANWALRHGVT